MRTARANVAKLVVPRHQTLRIRSTRFELQRIVPPNSWVDVCSARVDDAAVPCLRSMRTTCAEAIGTIFAHDEGVHACSNRQTSLRRAILNRFQQAQEAGSVRV